MWRRIVGISIGVVVGAALGCLGAFLLAPAAEPESGWSSYPTLAAASQESQGPALWQHIRSGPEFRFWLFLGVLLGGGFGAVTAAVLSVNRTGVQSGKP